MRVSGFFAEWPGVVEDGAAFEGWGDAALVADGGGEVGEGFEVGFDVAGEAVEAAEAFEFFGVSDFGGVEGAAEDGERFVVGFEWDGEGVSVFAAVGEGEAGGVSEAAGRAVDDFSDEGEGLKSAGAEAFDQ